MKKKWKNNNKKTLIKNHGNIKDIFMCNKIQKMKKKNKTAFVLFKFNYKSINKINDKSKKDKNKKKTKNKM